jgi:hypothetical protein
MMNEKIKQLASKCYKTGPLGRDGWPEYTSFDQEKFAELLIQECAKIVTIWSNEEPCSEGYDITPVLKMKEHFGIKE